MSENKESILITVDDLVKNFLYYDRKEDEDLPLGVIETEVEAGDLSIEEIAGRFERGLRESLG